MRESSSRMESPGRMAARLSSEKETAGSEARRAHRWTTWQTAVSTCLHYILRTHTWHFLYTLYDHFLYIHMPWFVGADLCHCCSCRPNCMWGVTSKWLLVHRLRAERFLPHGVPTYGDPTHWYSFFVFNHALADLQAGSYELVRREWFCQSSNVFHGIWRARYQENKSKYVRQRQSRAKLSFPPNGLTWKVICGVESVLHGGDIRVPFAVVQTAVGTNRTACNFVWMLPRPDRYVPWCLLDV